MSDGAFRDASAALERAAMLEQRNEELEAELAELRGVASEAARELRGDTLTSVRAELKSTLTKLTTATRNLDAMQENYHALRRDRDQLADDAQRSKLQVESFRGLHSRELELQKKLARARAERDDALEEASKLREILEGSGAEHREKMALARADIPEN